MSIDVYTKIEFLEAMEPNDGESPADEMSRLCYEFSALSDDRFAAVADILANERALLVRLLDYRRQQRGQLEEGAEPISSEQAEADYKELMNSQEMMREQLAALDRRRETDSVPFTEEDNKRAESCKKLIARVDTAIGTAQRPDPEIHVSQDALLGYMNRIGRSYTRDLDDVFRELNWFDFEHVRPFQQSLNKLCVAVRQAERREEDVERPVKSEEINEAYRTILESAPQLLKEARTRLNGMDYSDRGFATLITYCTLVTSVSHMALQGDLLSAAGGWKDELDRVTGTMSYAREAEAELKRLDEERLARLRRNEPEPDDADDCRYEYTRALIAYINDNEPVDFEQAYSDLTTEIADLNKKLSPEDRELAKGIGLRQLDRELDDIVAEGAKLVSDTDINASHENGISLLKHDCAAILDGVEISDLLREEAANRLEELAREKFASEEKPALTAEEIADDPVLCNAIPEKMRFRIRNNFAHNIRGKGEIRDTLEKAATDSYRFKIDRYETMAKLRLAEDKRDALIAKYPEKRSAMCAHQDGAVRASSRHMVREQLTVLAAKLDTITRIRSDSEEFTEFSDALHKAGRSDGTAIYDLFEKASKYVRLKTVNGEPSTTTGKQRLNMARSIVALTGSVIRGEQLSDQARKQLDSSRAKAVDAFKARLIKEAPANEAEMLLNKLRERFGGLTDQFEENVRTLYSRAEDSRGSLAYECTTAGDTVPAENCESHLRNIFAYEALKASVENESFDHRHMDFYGAKNAVDNCIALTGHSEELDGWLKQEHTTSELNDQVLDRSGLAQRVNPYAVHVDTVVMMASRVRNDIPAANVPENKPKEPGIGLSRNSF